MVLDDLISTPKSRVISLVVVNLVAAFSRTFAAGLLLCFAATPLMAQTNLSAAAAWLAAAPVAPGTPGFALGVNYPNPFRSSTVIPFTLSRDEAVRIAIVDARGAEVAVLENGFRTAGAHEASFRAEGLTIGTYFAVMHTTEGSAMQPLTVE